MLISKSLIRLRYPPYAHRVGCWCPWRAPSFCCAGLHAAFPLRGFLSAITVLFVGGCVFVPKAILASATEQWGIKVAQVEIKDVRIPTAMQRAMAAEAEAAREARAKVRPTAMSTPKLPYPCPRHPSASLFSPHCKGGLSPLWEASQCHFHFSYFAGCGSRGRNECF